MEKSVHTMGKEWAPIFQVLPIRWVLLHFPVLWEIDGETYAFPIWWSIPEDRNLMGKKHPYYGKVWVSISKTFPIRWVLLHFPVLWEIYGETHAFPISWHWLIFSCVSVSNGSISISSDIVITLRKSHKIIFVEYFWKTTNTWERCFQRPLKEVTQKICSSPLKDVTQKASFLRCFWEVLKTSQKDISFEMFLKSLWDISLNGDLIEISQRHLMPAGREVYDERFWSMPFKFKVSSN